MTKEESDHFWLHYGRRNFDNPALEVLYQAIKHRLQEELFATGFGRLIDRQNLDLENE